MPGLYGLGNANVTTSVTNTTGLYQQSGAVEILNGAEQLLTLLSNNGTVLFALDPTTGNTKVLGDANGASLYGNANVAAFLASNSSVPILTTGNITAPYFIGNGALLTGITAGTNYTDANVAAYLASGTNANNIITTANVQGAYILGNGSQLTGITVNYSNVNVAAYLPTYTGAMTSMTGNVTTTANISGAYILGNGSQLTGLPSASITLTGNVTGSGSTGSPINTLIAASGVTAGTYGNSTYYPTFTVGADGRVTNATSVAVPSTTVVAGTTNQVNVSAVGSTYTVSLPTTLIAPGTIQATGNVTATYFNGNGAALTGLEPTVRTNISVASNSGVYSDSNVQYNNTTGVITYNEPSYVMNAINLRFPVKNTSGGTLVKGTPIYATGTVGATDVIEVSASRADTASTMPAIGLLETTLNANDTGNAVQLGELSGFDTSTYTLGQTLYVGSTGGIVGTRPNNGYLVEPIGTVGRVNALTGIIVVNIWNYFQAPNLGSGNVWIGNANSIPTETVFSTAANSAIASYLPTYTGNIGAGNVAVTGNVSASYYSGNGSLLTSITGANVTGTVANATYATTAGSAGSATTATLAQYVTANAQANITSVGTLTSLSVTGNINSSANITAATTLYAANIITTGTSGNISGANYITANFFVGDGGLLTNISSAYGNTQVSAYLASGTDTANIITSGNISGTYFLGNGSQLTGITANYSNANVASYLPTYSGNLSPTNLIATQSMATYANLIDLNANITAGTPTNDARIRVLRGDQNSVNLRWNETSDYWDFTNDGSTYYKLPTSTTDLAEGTNLYFTNARAVTALTSSTLSGNITTTGNIAAGYFLGNGSQLTGITSNYGDTNVAAYLASGTITGNIITSANISGAYILGNGAFLTGIASSSTYGDSNVTALLASLGSNVISSTANITTTGNVTGNYILGNLGLAGTLGCAQVNYLGGFGNAAALVGQPLGVYTGGALVGAPGQYAMQAGQINFFGNSSVGSIMQASNAWAANTFPSPNRIWIGDNGPGDYSATLDLTLNTRGAGVMIAGGIPKYDNGIRESGLVSSKFYNLPANVGTANTNSRVGSITGDCIVIGPGEFVNTSPLMARASAYTFWVGVPGGSVIGWSNTNVKSGSGTINSIQVAGGCGIGNAYAYLGSVFGNTTGYFGGGGGTASVVNAIGLSTPAFNNVATYSGNVITVYNPGTTNTMGLTQQNAARRAPGYYFLKNEDDVAQNQMGSMKAYHEFCYAGNGTSGAVTISKLNGQVQYLTPTAAITSVDFSNFVTSASDSVNTDYQVDTVTLVVAQGATPYTVTMPTGNAQVKYAGGASTVTSTANAIQLITITATNLAGTVYYLVSISSEFS